MSRRMRSTGSLRASGKRGREESAEIQSESAFGLGWGARLTPANCHLDPIGDRVERYRDCKTRPSLSSVSALLPASFP